MHCQALTPRRRARYNELMRLTYRLVLLLALGALPLLFVGPRPLAADRRAAL